MTTQGRSLSRLALAALLGGTLAISGCYTHRVRYHHGHHGANALAFIGAAIITAAIITTVAPPPPRVIVVPEPRPGYAWQPGYWSRAGDEWVWVDGRWIELPPNYSWSPTHWEQAPDGTWQLVPGRWVRSR
jgi:hypothetical protein